MGINVSLQDLNTPTGSRLWSGEKIYLYCSEINYGMKNNIGKGAISLPDTDLISSDNSSYNLNYSRRKHPAQYVGINNPTIKVSCAWQTTLGSEVAGKKILTPHKLLKFALEPKTFYLVDENLFPSLSTGDGTYDPYYTGSGIPVILDDFEMKVNVEKDLIDIELNFVEDREVTDTR